MRCPRYIRRLLGTAAAVLLLLPGGVRSSDAALGGVSNLTISGGFTPGFTTVGTNGTLRWNPATTQHEALVNGVWTNLAGSGSGGTGSGFPLTNNADFGGFGATNIAFIGSDTNPGTEAFVMHDGTGYVHRYAAKAVTNILDLAAAIASSNKPHLYPMQLLKYTDGHVYYLTQEIDPVALGTNSYPLPGSHPAHWVVFVEKGATGATGASGADGADGADGFGYGWITPSWSASRGYDSNTLVSYNGRAYLSLLPNTNVLPTSTNTWLLYVDKGDSGTIVGTNYLLRGAWDAGELYATNDIVEYGGNLVIIGPTNISVAGVAPTLNSDGVATNSGNWSLHLARGMRGATGAAGADGVYTSFTNVTQVTIVYSNAVFLNTPTASNDVAKWQYETGGTNYFLWGTVSTTAGTLSNAASTSAWLTASVSGATVVVGSTNTPIFAESDPAALAQGYQTGAQVTSAIQLAISGSSSATNAIGRVTVNSSDYSGMNYLRLRGSSLLDFSAGPTVDVVFLADMVSTQDIRVTKPVHIVPDTMSDPRFGYTEMVLAPTNLDAVYTVNAASITSRPHVAVFASIVATNAPLGGNPVTVLEEVRNMSVWLGGMSNKTAYLRQFSPIGSNDYGVVQSLYHMWNGASFAAGSFAVQDHPAAPPEQADVLVCMQEIGGVPYFGLSTVGAGADTHSSKLFGSDSYLSINASAADFDLYFTGDTADQKIMSLEGDTTPVISWNGNGNAVSASTTNSTAANGVDWYYYGRTGVIMSANSATRAVTVGATLDAREGYRAAGVAGISSTTSVLVADGGGGFATQTWIHIYGIRTQ